MNHPQLPTVTRSDGTVVEATILERGSFGRKTKETRIFEPVVGPHGEVIAAEINTTLDKAGLRLVVTNEGQLQLTLHARQLGMVLYRDMCMGSAAQPDGTPIAASPIHWSIYEKLSEMKAKGQVPHSKDIPPEKIYHPEIVARRARRTDGVERVSKEAMAKILDEIRVPDTDEAIAAARKIGMRLSDSPTPPSLQELMDEAGG